MTTSPTLDRPAGGATAMPASADVADVVALLSSLSRLLRTSRSLGRRVQEELGASGTPLAVLKVLARADGHDRPGDLATATGVAPSVVSRVVAKLEEDGLVSRRRDEADARACHIELTDDGRAHLARVQHDSAALLAPALHGIPTEDLRRLPGIFARIEDAMVRATERTATARSATHQPTTEGN